MFSGALCAAKDLGGVGRLSGVLLIGRYCIGMKYPPVRLAMPDGVCEWLERELESRGIDAVVYTRYVLSLLRRDDIIVDNCKTSGLSATATATVRQRRRSYRATKCDPEQLRRTAAVDCLASACDQVK